MDCPENVLSALDVNCDGVITSYDAYLILMIEAEMIAELPKESKII